MITASQQQYQDYLLSSRWRMIRAARRRLDGYRCCNCGYAARLEVHHRSYRYRNRGGILGMLAELRDCVTLCHRCHVQEHEID